jgi:Spy/CpxP family protein refolding chaperone
MWEEPIVSNAFQYAAILVWGSVVLLNTNIQTARADGDHGGMMCGHMCKMHEGHDQTKHDEHNSHDLKHLLKHGKELGLTSEQLSKLKTMQLDVSRAQVRAEADIKVARLELQALVEDERADLAVIQGKVYELKKAEGGLLFGTIKARHDARAILTPEQREKVHALGEEVKEGEHEHSGGMKGMKGGGHGGRRKGGKGEGTGKEEGSEHQH